MHAVTVSSRVDWPPAHIRPRRVNNMAFEDEISKAAKNLDRAAEAAPPADVVDVDDFGKKGEKAEKNDSHDAEDDHSEPDDDSSD